MKLSVIIPVFNGAKTIGRLVQALEKELAPKFDLEIVLINDCSPDDNSAEVCMDIVRDNIRVKFLDLSKNFGEHNAVMCGLNYCTGEAAVIIDDDFQNPPSEVAKLANRLEDGYDVVFSYYKKKQHNFFRNLGSKLNNLLASILIPKPIGLYLSSFKAINRFVIDEVIKYTGPYPYIDGLILRITNNYHTVMVRHDTRHHGKSGYTFRKLLSLWLNLFTSFSVLPLRIATLMGFFFSAIGLFGAVFFIIEKMKDPNIPLGWATLIVSLLILTGVQLFAIGMIGEYIGRMFLKGEGKQQFVIRDSVNCDNTTRSNQRLRKP